MISRIVSMLNQRAERIRYRGHPVEYARHLGVKIGSDCFIYADVRSCFSTEPFLITIGDHVLIATGVRLFTHDGAGFTLAYGPDATQNAYFDIWGPIRIGNNVYIGTNAMILPNVTVCDNVIIGAGAVVTKSIDEDGVWVGVPARRIKSFKAYKEDVKDKVVDNSGLNYCQRKERFIELHPEWFRQ